MKYIFFILLASLCMAGCDSNRVYEDYKEFKTKTWLADDTVVFEFSIDDSTKKYNLYLNLRNSYSYPVSRIFINYTLTDSTNNEIAKQLTSNFLFDKSGRPFGRSGLGDVYDHQFLLLKDQTFKPGIYRFKFEQLNRDTLVGMLAVGVRVETVQ